MVLLCLSAVFVLALASYSHHVAKKLAEQSGPKRKYIGIPYAASLYGITALCAAPLAHAEPHRASNSDAFCVGYIGLYIKAVEKNASQTKNLASLRRMRQELDAKVKSGGITHGEKLLYNEGFNAAKDAAANNRTSDIDDTLRVCVGARAHPAQTEVNKIFYEAGMDSYFAKECRLKFIDKVNIRTAFDKYAKSTLIHQKYAIQRMHDFDKGVMDAKGLVLSKGFEFVLKSTGSTCENLERSLRERVALISKTTTK